MCLCLQHHCRNCGEIFCNSCSDNELPLPASPKPVRVCDTCHALLLQRCSSNPTWRSPTLLLQTIYQYTHPPALLTSWPPDLLTSTTSTPTTQLISTVFAAKNGPCAWTFSAFDLSYLQFWGRKKKSLTDKMRDGCINLKFVWRHYIWKHSKHLSSSDTDEKAISSLSWAKRTNITRYIFQNWIIISYNQSSVTNKGPF